jgi:hypothetical protein
MQYFVGQEKSHGEKNGSFKCHCFVMLELHALNKNIVYLFLFLSKLKNYR